MKLYIIGSLRNPAIPHIATKLRTHGYDAFDSWFAAGPTADDSWQAYSKSRGQSYREALGDYAAQHIFQYDRRHLNDSDAGVLVAPAGRSGYLELGYLLGRGVPGFILLEQEFDRWDVMAAFATVCPTFEDLLKGLAAI